MNEEFEFVGFHEFVMKLDKISEEYSDTAEKHLNKAGNKLKRIVINATPVGKEHYITKDGRKIVNKHYKHMKKRWKSSIKGLYGKDLEYHLKSHAPHFHLIDRGHVMTTASGRVTGFVQGTHFFQQAVNNYDASGEYEKELQKFMNDIKKKIEG